MERKQKMGVTREVQHTCTYKKFLLQWGSLKLAPIKMYM